jgi:hypothetical protein
MSTTRRRTFDDRDDGAGRREEPAPSHRCPAHGCPNAACISLGGGWMCYAHARAPSNTWPDVTREIRAGWPATANWNHPAKVEHEEREAAKRRQALPPRWRGAPAAAASALGIGDALGAALGADA